MESWMTPKDLSTIFKPHAIFGFCHVSECVFTKWQFGKKKNSIYLKVKVGSWWHHQAAAGWPPIVVTLVIVGGLDNLLCHLLKDEQEKEEEKMMRFLRKLRGSEQKINTKDLTRSHRRPSGLRQRLMFKNLTVCRCTLIVGGWFRWRPLTHVGMHASCLKALSSAHYPGPEEDPTHFSSVYRTSDLWNLDPAHVPGTRQNPAKISSPFSLREVYRCKKAL